ncbi:MAG: AAA family ATPase [bacterium]|nr:AAA family ATPase [bacterium]
MLLELRVKNFALIEHLQISLGEKFNVLTGETGAGKTILLQALGLLCGSKFLTGSARDETFDVTVEAIFTPKKSSKLKEVLDDLGLDFDPDEWVLRRTIHPGGRNRCSLNGNLLRVQDLKKLGPFLVDIHSQHQTGQLLDSKNHFKFLESYCSDSVKLSLETYRLKIKDFKSLQMRQQSAEQRTQELTREIARLESELKEIEEVRPELDEDRQLGDLHKRLVHRGEIHGGLENCRNSLDPAGDHSAFREFLLLEKKIEVIANLDTQLEARLDDIKAINLQIEELRQQLATFESELDNLTPQELFDTEARLASLEKLKRKYGSTIAEVLAYEEKAADILFSLQEEQKQIENLDSDLDLLGSELLLIADELQDHLATAAMELGAEVQRQLSRLKMKDACFHVNFEDSASAIQIQSNNAVRLLSLRSPKDCQFYLSANKGQPPLPLSKVASGGEISRTMLALKRTFSRVHSAQTFVFDEIDSGIGGETAHTVAEMLAEIANEHDQNILVITHLPQVAVRGDKHFRVQKYTQDERTSTSVDLLLDGEVRDEISRMMGLNGNSNELREMLESENSS